VDLQSIPLTLSPCSLPIVLQTQEVHLKSLKPSSHTNLIILLPTIHRRLPETTANNRYPKIRPQGYLPPCEALTGSEVGGCWALGVERVCVRVLTPRTAEGMCRSHIDPPCLQKGAAIEPTPTNVLTHPPCLCVSKKRHNIYHSLKSSSQRASSHAHPRKFGLKRSSPKNDSYADIYSLSSRVIPNLYVFLFFWRTQKKMFWWMFFFVYIIKANLIIFLNIFWFPQ